MVSEPFTVACEDVGTVLSRLTDRGQERHWDVVVGLTELPLRDGDGRYLLVETDPQHRTAVLSLPALGGLRMQRRSRHALRELISGMADPGADSGLNLVWAMFVLDPAVMGGYLGMTLSYRDLFVLSWFVASAATVGGALGSGLESDEAIRAAAYSKREQDRRNRLARDEKPNTETSTRS
ncbi:hypothetical protein [Nocardioides sp. URHA0032]|uniref:hypothetical protein n=1 Tax=Nocardioides sp. URHA0032 TaxID=1380388 RepID=UPI000687F938|nr:hypothetical protein [Nocardioides sp. URHA0032]